MKRLLPIIFGLLVFAVVPVMAADCPALVQQALAATDTMCSQTAKNQACYGNINLTAPQLLALKISVSTNRVIVLT